KLLRRESRKAGVSENRGQRGGKSERVRQHKFVTCLAELMPKIRIAIQHLTEDSFGTGEIHVAFLPRRACGEPLSTCDVALDSRVVAGKILLHQAIAIRARPVEDIVRIL